MSADFLLELLSEEIPARMQAKARNDLARMFADIISNFGLRAEKIEAFSTPRRLAIIARDLPAFTEPKIEERKGPRADAPQGAIDGFLKSVGLKREELEERIDAKGVATLFATKQIPGLPAAEAIRNALFAILTDFPWPKSMRWGPSSRTTTSMRWVRPLHGIVALLGEDIVPFEFDGIESGAATVGHRFHHPGPITIGSANDYVEKLRACHVIVDQEEREATIRDGAAEAAKKAGFELVEDEGLVVENAGLTELPHPLLGSFDPAFLDVPEEVIQLTARINQKYFVMRDGAGKLASNFVCIANIAATDDGAAIVAGNERVLAARLSDARFFWEQDLKVPLEEQAAKLSGIVFHEKLGTVADKVERVAKLSRWLVEEEIVGGSNHAPATSTPHSRESGNLAVLQGSGTPASAGVTKEELADQAERAARLAKADLVTGMVGEFPELQGLIGGYLARAQGEPDAVADAIRDHYKPVGQGDDVPTAPVTVAISLADKIDSLVCFFAIGERPSGSKDPFALRRAGLGVIATQIENQLRFGISGVVDAWAEFFDPGHNGPADLGRQLTDFFADRLKVQQRDAGVRHDLIDAVFALGSEDDLVRLLARVQALQAFVEKPEGTDLLAAYKRAANILKKEKWDLPRVMAGRGEQGIPQTGEEDPLVEVEEPAIAEAVAEMALGATHAAGAPAEEAALVAALDNAEPHAAEAVSQEDFTGAMAALSTLRGPIDAFFDKVTVNDPEPDVRARRLNLLARFRDAVNAVADFSKIEG